MRAKKELRREAKIRRRSLGEVYRRSASKIIAEKLGEAPFWQDASVVYLYYGCQDEVLTDEIIGAALDVEKSIYLPRVISDTEMVFIKTDSMNKLQMNELGIFEPEMPMGEVFLETPELIVMPCVGVTVKGDRIGHGRGYYDRYLEDMTDVPLVCLAFDCQIVEDFETDETDKKVDFIITESGIIRV